MDHQLFKDLFLQTANFLRLVKTSTHYQVISNLRFCFDLSKESILPNAQTRNHLLRIENPL